MNGQVMDLSIPVMLLPLEGHSVAVCVVILTTVWI